MRFVSPHKAIFGKSVSGTIDDTFLVSWLTDPSVNFPVQKTGSLSLSVSGVGNVDVLSVVNHSISQGATIGIGALGSIPTAAWRSDGIPYNFVRVLSSPTAGGTLSLTVSGNSGPVVIGMFYAGESYVFNDFLSGRRYIVEQPFPWEGEYASLAPYDLGIASQRRMEGQIILNAASFESLNLTFEAQRRGAYPVLWVDDDTVNDAWLCQINFDAEKTEGWYFVNLQIAEIPRIRWFG